MPSSLFTLFQKAVGPKRRHGIGGLRVTFHLQGPAIASDRAGLHTFIVQRAERFKFCSALPYKFICKYKKSRKESTIFFFIKYIFYLFSRMMRRAHLYFELLNATRYIYLQGLWTVFQRPVRAFDLIWIGLATSNTQATSCITWRWTHWRRYTVTSGLHGGGEIQRPCRSPRQFRAISRTSWRPVIRVQPRCSR